MKKKLFRKSIYDIHSLIDILSTKPSLIIFAERSDMGLSKVMKQTAQALSNREKVLYITYCDYKERIIKGLHAEQNPVMEQLIV